MRNLITDVAGLKVGHGTDTRLGSGATVVVFDTPAVASIDVRGGGPGTRETALLDPAQTVEGIDAIVLSGGSAFGLDAASGVQGWLKEQKRGFAVRGARVERSKLEQPSALLGMPRSRMVNDQPPHHPRCISHETRAVRKRRTVARRHVQVCFVQ